MAPYKRNVYCEIKFLEKIFEELSQSLTLCDVNIDLIKKLINIKTFIDQSRINLNIDSNTFKEQYVKSDLTTLYDRLWKRHTGAMSCVKFLEEHKVEFVEEQIVRPEGLNMAYLLNQGSAICEHYANKYGVICLCPTKECSYLFRDCGSYIQKGENFQWSGIFKDEYHLSYCNSMVIIDNYILPGINKNLLPIIEQLLPESLKGNLEFYLTIITHDDTKKNYKYEEIYNNILRAIQKKRPKLKCQVELYVKQGETAFHDRTILTNNIKIDSGAGFSLIKGEKSQHSTEIHILHPGIQQLSDTCEESYNRILKTAREITKKIDDKSKGYGMRYPVGQTCKNRLIMTHDENN